MGSFSYYLIKQLIVFAYMVLFPLIIFIEPILIVPIVFKFLKVFPLLMGTTVFNFFEGLPLTFVVFFMWYFLIYATGLIFKTVREFSSPTFSYCAVYYGFAKHFYLISSTIILPISHNITIRSINRFRIISPIIM